MPKSVRDRKIYKTEVSETFKYKVDAFVRSDNGEDLGVVVEDHEASPTRGSAIACAHPFHFHDTSTQRNAVASKWSARAPDMAIPHYAANSLCVPDLQAVPVDYVMIWTQGLSGFEQFEGLKRLYGRDES